jgi:dCTP deaminase
MPGSGFWSSETLKKRLESEKIVDPYDASAVKSCCYELSVGEEAFVTGENAETVRLKNGGTVAIPPGQVVLVLTQETLKMPLDAVGLLSIRFGFKARGLINVSGFHVDPGFEGKLVFSMYNAGVQTIHLGLGSRLFLLWLCSIDNATDDKYHGEHNKQEHLPDDAITNLADRMPSPFTLEKDVEALRNELRREVSGLKTILTVGVTLAITAFLASLKSCGSQPSSPPPIAVYVGSTPGPVSPSPTTSARILAPQIPSVPPDAPIQPTAAITPSATPLPSANVKSSKAPHP